MKSLDKNRLFLWHYIFAILVAFVLLYAISATGYETSSRVIYKTFGYIVFATLGGPIIETILVQFIPFKILKFLKIRNYYINLILLTAIFLIPHGRYNDSLLLFTLFGISCSIPVNYFLQTQKQRGTRLAVLRTILLHSAYNTTFLLISIIH